MAEQTIPTKFKLRHDIASNWTAKNPVLLEGELGFETDTLNFKVGDGTTNWGSLEYYIPKKLSQLEVDKNNQRVSEEEKTAWNNKVDPVSGKGLSTNDYTTEDKTKLESIEANAQVNTVNSVNGKTGNVVLSASDVGALPSDTEIPTVNNGTLTIQKNGTNIATFSANQSGNATANIIIPTTASDVSALPNSTKYGASLSLSMNTSTYVVTVQLKDQDGNNLGTAQTIDLPLESVVVSGAYNNTTKKVVLTLKDGSTVDFSVADLVSGLVSESSFNELEDRVATNESNISQNATNISNRYTKAEVNNLIKDFITKEVNNLTNYYTSAQIDAKGYLTSVPSNYVTTTELSSKNYATINYVDGAFTLISDLRTDLTALEETVEGLAGSSDLSDRVSTLETNQELINQQVNENYEKILEIDRDYVRTSTWSTLSTNVSTNTSDIATLKATVKNIPTKTSQLTNDSGYVTGTELGTQMAELVQSVNTVLASAVKTDSSNQSIAGTKTFTGSIIVPDVTIS